MAEIVDKRTLTAGNDAENVYTYNREVLIVQGKKVGGKDTIWFHGITNFNCLTFERNGLDLIIKSYSTEEKNNLYTTVTVQKYFKDLTGLYTSSTVVNIGLNNNGNTEVKSIITDSLYQIDSSATPYVITAKKGKYYLTASNFSDTIDLTDPSKVSVADYNITLNSGNDTLYSTSGNEIINLNSGNNKVASGAGNDIIYAGSNEDFMYFGKGDGANTVYNASNDDKICFQVDSLPLYGVNDVLTFEVIRSGKSNKDISLKITAQYSDGTTTSVTLYKYFNYNALDVLDKIYLTTSDAKDVFENDLFLNDYSIQKEAIFKINGAGTVNGTNYNDIINAYTYAKTDKVYTGYGDDIVYLGAGNDIVYLQGKTSEGSPADTKTINVFAITGTTDTLSGISNIAKLNINFVDSITKTVIPDAVIKYDITNSTLNIRRYDSTGANLLQTVSIINYETTQSDKIFVNGDNSLTGFDYSDVQLIGGVKRKVITVTNAKKASTLVGTNGNGVDAFGVENKDYSDYLIGGSKNDKIYSGDGNDIIEAKGGNDIIYLGGGDKIINYTIGDGNDTIHVGATTGVITLNIQDKYGNYIEDVTVPETTNVNDDLIVKFKSGKKTYSITLKQFKNGSSTRTLNVNNVQYNTISGTDNSGGSANVVAIQDISPIDYELTYEKVNGIDTIPIGITKTYDADSLIYAPENGNLKDAKNDYIVLNGGGNTIQLASGNDVVKFSSNFTLPEAIDMQVITEVQTIQKEYQEGGETKTFHQILEYKTYRNINDPDMNSDRVLVKTSYDTPDGRDVAGSVVSKDETTGQIIRTIETNETTPDTEKYNFYRTYDTIIGATSGDKVLVLEGIDISNLVVTNSLTTVFNSVTSSSGSASAAASKYIRANGDINVSNLLNDNVASTGLLTTADTSKYYIPTYINQNQKLAGFVNVYDDYSDKYAKYDDNAIIGSGLNQSLYLVDYRYVERPKGEDDSYDYILYDGYLTNIIQLDNFLASTTNSKIIIKDGTEDHTTTIWKFSSTKKTVINDTAQNDYIIDSGSTGSVTYKMSTGIDTIFTNSKESIIDLTSDTLKNIGYKTIYSSDGATSTSNPYTTTIKYSLDGKYSIGLLGDDFVIDTYTEDGDTKENPYCYSILYKNFMTSDNSHNLKLVANDQTYYVSKSSKYWKEYPTSAIASIDMSNIDSGVNARNNMFFYESTPYATEFIGGTSGKYLNIAFYADNCTYNGGNDKYYGGDANNVYSINTLNSGSKLSIVDGGGEDTLKINTSNTLKDDSFVFMFDVKTAVSADADGTINVSTPLGQDQTSKYVDLEFASDNLYILPKISDKNGYNVKSFVNTYCSQISDWNPISDGSDKNYGISIYEYFKADNEPIKLNCATLAQDGHYLIDETRYARIRKHYTYDSETNSFKEVSAASGSTTYEKCRLAANTTSNSKYFDIDQKYIQVVAPDKTVSYKTVEVDSTSGEVNKYCACLNTADNTVSYVKASDKPVLDKSRILVKVNGEFKTCTNYRIENNAIICTVDGKEVVLTEQAYYASSTDSSKYYSVDTYAKASDASGYQIVNSNSDYYYADGKPNADGSTLYVQGVTLVDDYDYIAANSINTNVTSMRLGQDSSSNRYLFSDKYYAIGSFLDNNGDFEYRFTEYDGQTYYKNGSTSNPVYYNTNKWYELDGYDYVETSDTVLDRNKEYFILGSDGNYVSSNVAKIADCSVTYAIKNGSIYVKTDGNSYYITDDARYVNASDTTLSDETYISYKNSTGATAYAQYDGVSYETGAVDSTVTDVQATHFSRNSYYIRTEVADGVATYEQADTTSYIAYFDEEGNKQYMEEAAKPDEGEISSTEYKVNIRGELKNCTNYNETDMTCEIDGVVYALSERAYYKYTKDGVTTYIDKDDSFVKSTDSDTYHLNNGSLYYAGLTNNGITQYVAVDHVTFENDSLAEADKKLYAYLPESDDKFVVYDGISYTKATNDGSTVYCDADKLYTKTKDGTETFEYNGITYVENLINGQYIELSEDIINETSGDAYALISGEYVSYYKTIQIAEDVVINNVTYHSGDSLNLEKYLQEVASVSTVTYDGKTYDIANSVANKTYLQDSGADGLHISFQTGSYRVYEATLGNNDYYVIDSYDGKMFVVDNYGLYVEDIDSNFQLNADGTRVITEVSLFSYSNKVENFQVGDNQAIDMTSLVNYIAEQVSTYLLAMNTSAGTSYASAFEVFSSGSSYEKQCLVSAFDAAYKAYESSAFGTSGNNATKADMIIPTTTTDNLVTVDPIA